MPVPLALYAYLQTKAHRERPHTTDTPGERVPLARSGRGVRRFWRRSQAEKATIAHPEAARRAVAGS
jgi:hypothetical protein